MSFFVPKFMEVSRVQLPGYPPGDSKNGAFMVRSMGLKIIASEGAGWQHVSVSRNKRTPSYEDMQWAKEQFWSDDVCVMQLHVPKSAHVNYHKYCLHLWCPIIDEKMECPDCGETPNEIPRPPSIMVGI